MLLVAAILMSYWIWIHRSRLRIKRVAVIPFLSVGFVAYALFCAKLFSAAENGSYGGMSLYGGVFGMPIAFFIVGKMTHRDLADVFDIFTIPTVLTVMCARVNCLFAGCCLGTMIPHTNMRWPVRQIELVFYAGLIVYLGNKVLHGEIRGEAYPFYMCSYGLVRFILEFIRVSDSRFLFHKAHLWSFIALTLGFTIYTQLKSRTKGTQNHDRGK